MPAFPISASPKLEEVFPLSKEESHHLTKSLRIKLDQSFEVLLPNGQKGEAVLCQEGKNYYGKLTQLLETIIAPPLPLWLGVGMIRWPRLEWLMEKATELGVARITPLLLERSRFKKASEVSNHKLERLRKIAEETLKQCERVVPLEIDEPKSLAGWLSLLNNSKDFESPQKILFNEKVEQPVFSTQGLNPKASVLLIGPEGGFSDAELKLAEGEGFQSFSLGSKRLKTETAAIYGACVVDAIH